MVYYNILCHSIQWHIMVYCGTCDAEFLPSIDPRDEQMVFSPLHVKGITWQPIQL